MKNTPNITLTPIRPSLQKRVKAEASNLGIKLVDAADQAFEAWLTKKRSVHAASSATPTK